MVILEPKDNSISQNVNPIAEAILDELVQECLQVRKDDDANDLYSKFYRTKYIDGDFSFQDAQLTRYLEQLHNDYGDKVRTKLQNKEYCWVNVNTSQMGEIAYRYYLAPNPSNMHEIVKNLVTTFATDNVPVSFKYQLPQKMDECDRIIIYSDSFHRSQVEEKLEKVYAAKPELFADSERALPWIYPSKIPNVFLAPETPGSPYGQEFSTTMLQAKEIFCYLYGMTEAKSKISLSGNDTKEALEYMRLIIGSLLYRNGLLLSKDLQRVPAIEPNIKTQYDYKTGTLLNTVEDNIGYHRITFTPTMEGKKALLANFYHVSQVQEQTGIIVEHLTPDERKREIYEALYGDKSQAYLSVKTPSQSHK